MKQQRGMTLLEVMVALALLAIAGLALIDSSSEQVRNLSRLEQKQVAYLVADNKLTRLQLQQRWPPQSWQHGSSLMARQRWYWRWRGASTSDPAIRMLEIEVYRDPSRRDTLATLHSWQVKP
ncbi:type II secretion system minor pseudopilin GspI [Erwinia sp. Eh17-17]|uniref:type II secretion system minor pseudopilin GspI n=1 Tax=Erwinia sp. Eh17-17 TaxID=3080330 RepID=UPI003209C123